MSRNLDEVGKIAQGGQTVKKVTLRPAQGLSNKSILSLAIVITM